jgi:hypothetical protein
MKITTHPERAYPGTHLVIDAEDDDIEIRLGMAKSLSLAVFFSLDSKPDICVSFERTTRLSDAYNNSCFHYPKPGFQVFNIGDTGEISSL